MKKIVFLGNFDVSYTTESHHLKTYRKLGYEVLPLQEGKTNAQQILERATKADYFCWTHTHGIVTEGMAEVLSILKDKGIPTYGYHLDLWLGIDRQRDLEVDPYWNIEYFFTVDRLMAELMNNRDDLPQAYYLPAGVFEDETYIAEYNPELAHDIVFVGSSMYHKEWGYRAELIAWLKETYKNKFAHYGRGGKGIIREKSLNELYTSSKIVIGDTLCKGFEYPYYLSDRVFETTGRNGFIIHPYIVGIEDLFGTQDIAIGKDGENLGYLETNSAEIITYPFGNFKYLKYLIDYYLVNDEEREAIRARGHERAVKDHTYTSRLNYILETINENR